MTIGMLFLEMDFFCDLELVYFHYLHECSGIDFIYFGANSKFYQSRTDPFGHVYLTLLRIRCTYPNILKKLYQNHLLVMVHLFQKQFLDTNLLLF